MIGNKRLAIIARMDDSGLGHQTRNLVRLLEPDLVVAVDFTFYNGFKQHPEWYLNNNVMPIEGFISDEHVQKICDQADLVLTCETFYNNKFIDIADNAGVFTFNQINYEFFEPLANRQLVLPSRILMPSQWHLDDLQRLTVYGKVEHLPPPTFVDDFDEVRAVNYKRKGKRRFLHVAGKMAAHDRAGTKDLLACIERCVEDFELVVKVQVGEKLECSDKRVKFDYSFPEDERDLYRNFDAMIMPRRYAGLNLPMNEALASGLPVIMTDISPNNQILPLSWLVPAYVKNTFVARTAVDVFATYLPYLSAKIDQLAGMDDKLLKENKDTAYRIATQEFSPEVVKERWDALMVKWGII